MIWNGRTPFHIAEGREDSIYAVPCNPTWVGSRKKLKNLLDSPYINEAFDTAYKFYLGLGFRKIGGWGDQSKMDLLAIETFMCIVKDTELSNKQRKAEYINSRLDNFQKSFNALIKKR